MSPLRALEFAWATYRRRWRLLVPALLVVFGGWVLLEVAVVAAQRLGFVFWAVAHLAFLTFAAGVEVGILRACLALHDGGDPAFSDLFSQLRVGPAMLAAQVLFSLAFLAGLVLLVVPGAYLAARYGLFGFPLASGQASFGDSFRESARATARAWPRLLVLLLVLLFLNAAGAAFLGVGLLVSLPISFLALASAYRQLVPAL